MDGTVDTGNLTGGEWRAQLSDDLKANETFTPFKTVSDFAKAHLETVGKAQELEGRLGKAVIVPGEGAKDEDWAAFYGRLGRPEKADDYALAEFPVPQGLTDQNVVEAIKKRGAEDLAWFRGAAHKHGLTKGQAEQLFGEYAQRHGEYFAAMEQQREQAMVAAMTELQKDPEWSGEKMKVNLGVVEKVLATFGTPELKQWFDATGQGNNALIIKFFHKVGKAMGEDNLITGGTAGAKKDGWSYPSMDEKK